MRDQSPRQGGGDESLDYDHESSQDVSAQDIANIPWAQPPPRDPSPLPSPLQRQPSFSFLASDPAQPALAEHDTLSRRSSRSSISSRRSHNVPQPWSATAPATYLVPSADHSHDPHQHRLSSQTVHSYQSGMADMGTVEEMGIPPLRQGPNSQDDSHTSAMAVRASSSMSNRSLRSTLQSKIRSLKSKNSSKSTASSKKRISNSTIRRRSFQRKYGKWEVEMSPLLEKDDLRRMEETLELAELLGRATVLERMLKAGQRVRPPSKRSELKLIFRYPVRILSFPPFDALLPNLPNHPLDLLRPVLRLRVNLYALLRYVRSVANSLVESSAKMSLQRLTLSPGSDLRDQRLSLSRKHR